MNSCSVVERQKSGARDGKQLQGIVIGNEEGIVLRKKENVGAFKLDHLIVRSIIFSRFPNTQMDKNNSQRPPSLPTNYWPLSYLRLPPYEIKMIISHIPRISLSPIFLTLPITIYLTNDRPYSHEDQESQHTQIHYSSPHNHYNTVP